MVQVLRIMGMPTVGHSFHTIRSPGVSLAFNLGVGVVVDIKATTCIMTRVEAHVTLSHSCMVHANEVSRTCVSLSRMISVLTVVEAGNRGKTRHEP